MCLPHVGTERRTVHSPWFLFSLGGTRVDGYSPTTSVSSLISDATPVPSYLVCVHTYKSSPGGSFRYGTPVPGVVLSLRSTGTRVTRVGPTPVGAGLRYVGTELELDPVVTETPLYDNVRPQSPSPLGTTHTHATKCRQTYPHLRSMNDPSTLRPWGRPRKQDRNPRVLPRPV